MEITPQKSGDLLLLRLAGRLDANWCGHVQSALASAVKDGEHRMHLDMAEVSYMSSAGIRVLLTFYKQLNAINGIFGVVNPSKEVRTVLDLSGLSLLITEAVGTSPAKNESGVTLQSARASWTLFSPSAAVAPLPVSIVGTSAVYAGEQPASSAVTSFDDDVVALGVGALGISEADHASRAGELLAAAGAAAFQPADGSTSRPDFMVKEGALVPQGRLSLGITCRGPLQILARFEASKEARAVGLTELAEKALEVAQAKAVVMVGLTETAGLVGASLRRSPLTPVSREVKASDSEAALGDRFAFPEIREWLSFTSERAFRDSTSLFVGVAALPGSGLDPLLRPMWPGSSLLGHFHAAVFPYRPLRKGNIPLKSSIVELFEGVPPQTVLHLLADSRGISGAGESEFYRGALWMAPLTFIPGASA